MNSKSNNDATADRKRKILLVLLGITLVGAIGYAAMSCQSVRRQIIGTVDTGYKSPASDIVRAKGAPQVDLRVVVDGVSQPTDLRMYPGNADVLIVLSKGGKATWHNLKTKKRGAFFSSDVRSQSELGLLGIAFHPDFEKNGKFFVNENPKTGALRTRISEYKANPNDVATGATFVRSILEVDQPYQNHDGGQLRFGPDRLLYIGLGDGGWRADPEGHGQNLGTLLGAILRIDVDKTSPGLAYAIPADNPFVAQKGARGEIYAYGIRNPWRFAFAEDGRIIVADVGQDKYEEVTLVSKGENHGWSTREAGHCFSPKTGCTQKNLVDPVFEYDHSVGNSITGGVVYRGKSLPSLAGKYIFADFVRGHVWAMRIPSVQDAKKGPDASLAIRLGTFPLLISAFTHRDDGEILVADFGGSIRQLVRAAPEGAAAQPKSTPISK